MQFNDCKTCDTCANFCCESGQCRKLLSNTFSCEKYTRAQCLSCFFYSKLEASCKKGLKTYVDMCPEYTQHVETQKDRLSIQDISSICIALRSIQPNRIEVRFDTDSSLAANTSRGKILLFIEKLFVNGIKELTPSFFVPYLYTLEPFMYIESIVCLDPEYAGCKAHIFEYPCGTQSIQIKIVMRNSSIQVISFHQGVDNLNQLQRSYAKSAVLRTTGQFYELYFGTYKMDSFMAEWDESEQVYKIDSDRFIREYLSNLQDAIQDIIQSMHYLAEDISPIKKLTTKGAISIGSVNSAEIEITDFCILHANLTLLTLSDSVALQDAVMKVITPLLSQEYIELLQEMDSKLLNKIASYLPQKGIHDELADN